VTPERAQDRAEGQVPLMIAASKGRFRLSRKRAAFLSGVVSLLIGCALDRTISSRLPRRQCEAAFFAGRRKINPRSSGMVGDFVEDLSSSAI